VLVVVFQAIPKSQLLQLLSEKSFLVLCEYAFISSSDQAIQGRMIGSIIVQTNLLSAHEVFACHNFIILVEFSATSSEKSSCDNNSQLIYNLIILFSNIQTIVYNSLITGFHPIICILVQLSFHLKENINSPLCIQIKFEK
jgi:hypothetical protein